MAESDPPTDPPAVIEQTRVAMAHGVEFVRYMDQSWLLRTHDLGLLRDRLGAQRLWCLARCFEALDRLLSLEELLPFKERPTTRETRNQWTAFVLSIGVMRDFGHAIASFRGKEPIPPKGVQAWKELAEIGQRWKSGEFKDARDNLAFHLDETQALFNRGSEEMIANGEAVVIATGDSPRREDTSFAFGSRVLALGLWRIEPGEESLSPSEQKAKRAWRFNEFLTILIRDQQKARTLLEALLFVLLEPDTSPASTPR